MLLETKKRSNVDGNASFSFINEVTVMLLKLRSDLLNSTGEPRLEVVNFILGIPEIGCLLSALRVVLDKAHEAPIGEANSPSFFSFRRRLHLE